MGFNLERVLKDLIKERTIFASEADFQLALAWKIKEAYSDVEVRCEYPIKLEEGYIHLDIMVFKRNGWIPIELKYKTTTLNYADKCSIVKEDGVEYCLKNQGAKDLGCYDYRKDIYRIENIRGKKIGGKPFLKGYTVFLTNDSSYLKPPRIINGLKPFYYSFSIHGFDEKKNPVDNYITEEADWLRGAGEGTKKGRDKVITLSQDYKCEWKTNDSLKIWDKDIFKYLLHEIKKID